MAKIKGMLQFIPKYKIVPIHSDEVSDILSFFKKEHYKNGKLSPEILDEKKDELNKMLEDAWINKNPYRLEAFLSWLNKYEKEWEKTTHPHLSGLEWDFFLKMKKPPFEEYLIVREDTLLELNNKEQVGIIYSLKCRRENLESSCKHCEDRPCANLINKYGENFQEVLNKTHVKNLSKGSYEVYKNIERELYNLFKEDLEEEAKNNNKRILNE
jgi:hypothetical protein